MLTTPCIVITVVTFLVGCSAGAQDRTNGNDESTIRRLISLIDYIGGDYGEAVNGGKVINANEFKEMEDFAAGAAREFAKVRSTLAQGQIQKIDSNLATLQSLINQKADISAVQAVTKLIRSDVLNIFQVVTSPNETPNFLLGREVYREHCASCHGGQGKGDGPAGKNLEPSPRNFHESAPMDQASPFKFFNVLLLGVDGTGMPSFQGTLTNHELWSVAFYLAGIRHRERADLKDRDPQQILAGLPPAVKQLFLSADLNLDYLARTSDVDLRAWTHSLIDKNSIAAGTDSSEYFLALLRVAFPYDTQLSRYPLAAGTVQSFEQDGGPEGGALPSEEVFTTSFQFMEQKLIQAEQEFNEGQHSAAETSLLDAYLEGFEKLEAALSIKEKSLVSEVERDFLSARAAARTGNAEAFSSNLSTLKEDLGRARSILDISRSENHPQGINDFISSFIVILREGFEAFLVVIALLAVMRGIGSESGRKWVHAGWISAIACGFLTFAVTNMMINLSSATNETIEAVSSLLAAGVLFYVSFWMLSQAERQKWDQYLKASANAAATSGKLWVLFFLSFIAVYREAAETVLFYQAILSSATSLSSVIGGFAAGCLSVLLIVWMIVQFGLRLPLRQFFLITSLCMMALSVILVGKGIFELVEAGFLKPTLLAHWPSMEIFGFYNFLETILAQGLMVLAALGLWLFSKRKAFS